jgi:hypothetical protein
MRASAVTVSARLMVLVVEEEMAAEESRALALALALALAALALNWPAVVKPIARCPAAIVSSSSPEPTMSLQEKRQQTRFGPLITQVAVVIAREEREKRKEGKKGKGTGRPTKCREVGGRVAVGLLLLLLLDDASESFQCTIRRPRPCTVSLSSSMQPRTMQTTETETASLPEDSKAKRGEARRGEASERSWTRK